jgi:Zn-dependent peptidase ImmA (M78 family)
MPAKVNWRKPLKVARVLLDEMDIRQPPVPVNEIARHMGADVRYKPAERDICGFIARQDDGSTVIGINTFHHANRQRFTLAHELGHLSLHTTKRLYVDHVPKFRDVKSSQAVDPEEIEANLFAAELLMPEDMLRRDIQSMRDDLNANEAIDRLAKRYQVSPEAMRARLERLKGAGLNT